MEMGPVDSVDAAAETFLRLRSFQPFRFSGVWFVSRSPLTGVGLAFTRRAHLEKRFTKDACKMPAESRPASFAAIRIG